MYSVVKKNVWKLVHIQGMEGPQNFMNFTLAEHLALILVYFIYLSGKHWK